MAYVQMICTRQTFRPYASDGATWWRVEDWTRTYEAHQGMWPGVTFWSEEEWRQFYAEGYRYCDLLVDGRAVATAGLWPRTDEEWGPIAIGTAPARRNRGHGKAIVSFVTQAILDAGRAAVVVTREDNVPMRHVAAALGYELRPGSWLATVADLIVALQRLDPGLEVLCYTEDEGAVSSGREYALLDIAAVGVTDSRMVRDDRVPSLNTGPEPDSRKVAVLHVTSDF